MTSHRLVVIGAQLGAAVLVFFLGRWTATSGVLTTGAEQTRHAPAPSGASATVNDSPHRGSPNESPRGAALQRSSATERAPAETDARADTSPHAAALVTCTAELSRVQLQLSDLEREKKAMHGEPIPPRASEPASRFAEKPLLSAVQGAFKSTGIAGRIDTVDCSEFPCIVYGRVNGDEEMVAKLEDAKPLEIYDQDIGVMLTWSSGDQSLGQGTAKTSQRQKPQEISLFAFAFYTAADKAKYGDTLDRRIRSRTADLWNALRPDDQ